MRVACNSNESAYGIFDLCLVQISTCRRKLHDQANGYNSRGFVHSVLLDDHFAAGASAHASPQNVVP